MALRSKPAARIAVPPFFRILGPGAPPEPAGVAIVLDAGAGFGDGAHETTQLCLQAIAAARPSDAPARSEPWRMLDFGSGSGILAVAAAKLGARVDAVDIDERAIEHAARNLRLNAVAERVRLHRSLDGIAGPYDLVVANVLRPVLVAFAAELGARLRPDHPLVLSGLVSTDVPEIIARFGAALGGRRPSVHARGEWRAVVYWRDPGARTVSSPV